VSLPSDRFLQFLRRPERDLLAGGDLHRGAGGRITPHARRAVFDLKDEQGDFLQGVRVVPLLKLTSSMISP
jgi:hypothetical protein